MQLPTCIYLVTEEAVPLVEHLKEKEGYSDFSLTWGMHQTIVRGHKATGKCYF